MMMPAAKVVARVVMVERCAGGSGWDWGRWVGWGWVGGG